MSLVWRIFTGTVRAPHFSLSYARDLQFGEQQARLQALQSEFLASFFTNFVNVVNTQAKADEEATRVGFSF